MADGVAITAGAGTTVATDDIGGVHYQRVKLTFGADGSATDVSTAAPLPIAGNVAAAATDSGNPVKIGGYASSGIPTTVTTGQRQNVFLSTSGAVQVGGIQSAVGDADASNLILFNDTNGSAGKLSVGPSYYNGSTWDRMRGNTAGLWVQGNAVHDAVDSGNPVKIGGKAVSAIPASVASLDRVDALFDVWGRQGITDLDPETGYAVGTTSLRDRLYAQRYTVLADSIADGLTSFWTTTTASSGTVTVTAGEGLIDTTANATGSAMISSSVMMYHPGQVSWLNSAVRFNDTGSAGNIRRIGAFTVSGTTPQDGFYFELSATTLNAVSVKAGVATTVASASWSRVTDAPFTLDTNYHSFELRWTANSCHFYIDNVLRHVASGGASAITTTLNFPMTVQSINTSGATSRLIAVRNIGMGRFGTPDNAPVRIENEPMATYRGRVATFRTPGRAGTAGQKIFAIHNATGSTRTVRVNKLIVDKYETVVKAVTVAPPIIRAHRFTAVPTNGTTLTKTAKDTGLTSNASVTAWGDASADNTGSATTLTVTIPANSCIAQEFASRLITAAGYEMADKVVLLEGESIVLRPLEGIVVNLDYTLATQNPVTDMWTVVCDWWESA